MQECLLTQAGVHITVLCTSDWTTHTRDGRLLTDVDQGYMKNLGV